MASAVDYKYLHESDISDQEYLEFLRKYYHNRAEYRLFKRYSWYKNYLGFHCLLAFDNGEIVGQSCAFRVRMMTPTGEQEWWWGCDSFVLEAFRGKGIGKGLQKKLFADHKNFSSLGYSKTNGHIKKKMGSRSLAKTYPSIHLFSSYISVFVQIALFKTTGRRLSSRMFLPFNPFLRLLCKKSSSNYRIVESEFSEENVKFIQRWLEINSKFYVIRDKTYLKWKYDENPSVQYHLLEVRKNSELKGVILFSVDFDGSYIGCPLRLCKLYDLFIEPSCGFSNKDAIYAIFQFYKNRNIAIDGISSLWKIGYWPTVTYPRDGIEFLSSYSGDVSEMYMSESDQDLDQLRFLEKYD